MAALKSQVIVIDHEIVSKVVKHQKVAIVIALYYEEDFDKYIKYIMNIPEGIDIYIISSNKKILAEAALLKCKIDKLNIVEKNNRGRDLSALLVAFRPYVEKYSYFCFIHDKKSKHESLNEDISLWIENLWGNMIYSETYIDRVLELLKRENYGVLLPPKPIGTYNDSMYTDPWDNDFENVVQLAKKLNITMTISREDRAVVSLGSVFWCQSKALKKIFECAWTYEDFPEEPMPDDGTISHAIERIIGFVAIDAGYQIATIMNSEYASRMIEILQEKLQYTYDWLWKNQGIKNTYQLSQISEEKEAIAKIFRCGNVYLYGAGDYGIQYLQKLKVWGYKPQGFVVSDGERKCDTIQGMLVKELSELKLDESVGLIITTNPALQEILISNLEKNNFTNYYKVR